MPGQTTILHAIPGNLTYEPSFEGFVIGASEPQDFLVHTPLDPCHTMLYDKRKFFKIYYPELFATANQIV